MKRLIIAGIRSYRRWISPAFPASCRFFPTCSSYAMEALERKGACKGLLLTVKRLMKCHPWHPGGFDPVPSEGDAPASGRGTLLNKEIPADRSSGEFRTVSPATNREAL